MHLHVLGTVSGTTWGGAPEGTLTTDSLTCLWQQLVHTSYVYERSQDGE